MADHIVRQAAFHGAVIATSGAAGAGSIRSNPGIWNSACQQSGQHGHPRARLGATLGL
jgi:hypothetical protein